jgi:hypothetical protein
MLVVLLIVFGDEKEGVRGKETGYDDDQDRESFPLLHGSQSHCFFFIDFFCFVVDDDVNGELGS